ncbi:Surfeit locus 2, partial [Globisporangium splendens]
MVDLSILSRKDLQALAKEFQLCRGNAKSDVILQHVQDFVRANPKDGEQRVRQTLGLSADDAPAKSAMKQVQAATEMVLKAAAEDAKSAGRTHEAVAAVVAVAASVVAGAAVSGVLEESPKKTKAPEKKTCAAESTAKPAAATKKTLPKSAPAVVQKKSPAMEPTLVKKTPTKEHTPMKKSPAKEPTPTMKSPAKEVVPSKKSPAKASPKQHASRPALASLDNNVVKSKTNARKTTTGTVDSLVSSIDDLVYSSDGSKVRCTTTGHEMKADKDVITAYISGKSYQRARAKKQSFASYAPMFTAHPDEKKAHLLWCHVTETEHPRDIARIEAHIQAVRYQKELPRWQEAEAARVKAEAVAAARAAAKAKARAEKVKQLAAKTEDEAPPKKSKSRKRKHRGNNDKTTTQEATDDEPSRQRARMEQ